MSKTACRIRNLANDGLCRVDYCQDCACFHLKVGYTSLQIRPDAFLRLCGTLNTALARYRRLNDSRGPQKKRGYINDPGLPH